MSDVEELKKERIQIYSDLYSGKTPKRLLVGNPMQLEASAAYAGIPIAEANWDPAKKEEAVSKVAADFKGDTGPAINRRYALYFQLLGARTFIMASTGYLQHPDVHGMEPEDYDALIKSPYDCIMERILPRLYRELDTTPEKKMLALAKALKANADEAAAVGAINGRLAAKYGYPGLPGSQTTAPFDFLADFFRSFKGINGDLRRYPEKVIEACDALLPLQVKKGQIAARPKFGATSIPLHMGPFLNTKDFEKFYWPSLKKLIETLTEMGITVSVFCEHDFTRFLDHLQDLPANTILRFEYGDPKLFTEKLGKKFVLSGLFPLSSIHEKTKEQCLDDVKRFLDIVMPRSHLFYFSPNKEAMDIHGNFVENMKAVQEYILEHAHYDNPEGDGTLFEKLPNRSTEIVAKIDKDLSANSKYFTNWEDYLGSHPELAARKEPVVQQRVMAQENQMFNFIINICS